jgi:hypothetical protein
MEGFIVRSNRISQSDETLIIACDGNTPANQYTTFPDKKLGLYYATYTLLGLLGFGFYHPLAPACPKPFIIPKLNNTHSIDIKEKPYWPIRGTLYLNCIFYQIIHHSPLLTFTTNHYHYFVILWEKQDGIITHNILLN